MHTLCSTSSVLCMLSLFYCARTASSDKLLVYLVCIIFCFLSPVGVLRRTALHYAAFYGHADVARALILAGANVCSRGGGNSTPLHFAAWGGNKKGKSVNLSIYRDFFLIFIFIYGSYVTYPKLRFYSPPPCHTACIKRDKISLFFFFCFLSLSTVMFFFFYCVLIQRRPFIKLN